MCVYIYIYIDLRHINSLDRYRSLWKRLYIYTHLTGEAALWKYIYIYIYIIVDLAICALYPDYMSAAAAV